MMASKMRQWAPAILSQSSNADEDEKCLKSMVTRLSDWSSALGMTAGRVTKDVGVFLQEI